MAEKEEEGTKTGGPLDSGGRLDPVRLTAEHGSADAALRALAYKLNDVERDNAALRAEVRDWKGKVPTGARVLTAEEAAAYEAYAALGKADEVKVAIERAAALQAEIEKRDHADTLRQVAEAEGLQAAPLMKYLPGLKVTLKDVQVEGKPVKQGFAALEDGQEVRLSEYLEANHAELLPALRAQQQSAAQAGPVFVPQKAAGTAGTAAASDEVVRAQQARRLKVVI